MKNKLDDGKTSRYQHKLYLKRSKCWRKLAPGKDHHDPGLWIERMHNHPMAKAEGTLTSTSRHAIIPGLQRQPNHVAGTDKFETIRQERLGPQEKDRSQANTRLRQALPEPRTNPMQQQPLRAPPIIGRFAGGCCNTKMGRQRPQSSGSASSRTTTSSCS